MKKYISLLCISVVLATAAWGQSPQDLMREAVDAYGKADYTGAIEAYNTVLDSGYQSAVLYYNLGNAYYRLDELGLAILNYERALRMKPNMTDAKQNLELANIRIEDDITPLPELFVKRWVRNITAWFSPTGWRIVVLCLLALLAVATVLFASINNYRMKRSTLIGGFCVALLLLVGVLFAIASSNRFNRHDQAIVTSPMIVVKGSPEPAGVDKLILHEGTKLTIDETFGDWHKVHLSDGNTGWVETEDVTVI